MMTSSKELAQGGFEVVHLNVLFPTPNPVMVVFGKVGEVIVPLPPIKVHAPEPAVGVFAAITALELTQTVWSGPAADTEGGALTVIVTLEVEEVQGGLLIDHVKTETPGLIFVNPEFLKRGFAIVPVPDTKTHKPEPAAGLLPARKVDAVPVVAQSVWFGPAFATVGIALPTMIILSNEAAQGAFEMVHLKVLFPTPNPVMVEFGELGETIVPLPPIKVQTPVPAVGVFAAITALELIQTV